MTIEDQTPAERAEFHLRQELCRAAETGKPAYICADQVTIAQEILGQEGMPQMQAEVYPTTYDFLRKGAQNELVTLQPQMQ